MALRYRFAFRDCIDLGGTIRATVAGELLVDKVRWIPRARRRTWLAIVLPYRRLRSPTAIGGERRSDGW